MSWADCPKCGAAFYICAPAPVSDKGACGLRECVGQPPHTHPGWVAESAEHVAISVTDAVERHAMREATALLAAFAERCRSEAIEECAKAVESIHHCTDHVLSECPGHNADWIRCTAKRLRALTRAGSGSKGESRG